MGERAYSYHTFYFPFLWRDDDKKELADVYKSCVRYGWVYTGVDSFEEAGDDKSANYQTVQYFTPAARQSIFGFKSDFVKCLSYPIPNKSMYHIEKEDKKWDLLLDGIRLKLFNTGIGILSIECENHDYKSLEDVKSINEYGRRIYAPFFALGNCPLCADVLGFYYETEYKSFDCISSRMPEDELDCVPEFIRKLFPQRMYLKPAIDDRMFVASLVNVSEVEFRRLREYRNDDEKADSLYEFIYIDKEGDCSCPAKEMRDALLEKSVYTRWKDTEINGKCEGTIFGVTHHSFVCITACTPQYIVELPFLTIYNHLVSSVLAQRAAILAFDGMVSNLSKGLEMHGCGMKSKKIKKLQDLQERYIAFLSQHMNIEVTNQEQGVELSEMFKRELYIKEEIENLEKEIDVLTAAADTKNDNKLNRFAILLTVVILFIEPILSRYLNCGLSFLEGLFFK